MKQRYEAKNQSVKDTDHAYSVFDNLNGKYISFVNYEVLYSDGYTIHPKADAIEIANKLNQEDKHRQMSERIMSAAGIKGIGSNLCNEFNFPDLWEVVEWIVQCDVKQHIEDESDVAGAYISFLFGLWYSQSAVWTMKQHEMQVAIVEKIYELMIEAGLIKDDLS